jgi:hypothetical protein
MTHSMPEDTKCAGCNLPIKGTELFVGYRFGGGVRFWHNGSRATEDCWGKFLLEHAQRVHAVHPRRPPGKRLGPARQSLTS